MIGPDDWGKHAEKEISIVAAAVIVLAEHWPGAAAADGYVS